jgi:hypothetical protein
MTVKGDEAIINISVLAYHQQYINSVNLQQYISSAFPYIIHHLYYPSSIPQFWLTIHNTSSQLTINNTSG